MSNSLTQLSDDLAAVVESGGKSVVAIYGDRMPSSGVHWSPGLIVTTAHSLRRDDDIKIGFSDGSVAAAELAGRDPGSDLAVLKVDAARVPVIKVSDDAARTGDVVLAIGRHRDIGVCAAMGIVSVVGPGWNTWRGGTVDRFVRLDVSLYPGSSGAAVVNAKGEAIGIATSALSRIAPVAIPRATVDRVSSQIATRGYVARGYLGVGMQPIPLPEDLGTRGLVVLSVEKDSPAARAGVVIGDILVGLGGGDLKDTRDVQSVLGPESIGKTIPASIIRGGKRMELSVTVGEK